MSKSKPWRVIIQTAGETPETTDHRSEKAKDQHVWQICKAMRTGTTNAHTITVQWWDTSRSRYSPYEVVHRKDITPETQETKP